MYSLWKKGKKTIFLVINSLNKIFHFSQLIHSRRLDLCWVFLCILFTAAFLL